MSTLSTFSINKRNNLLKLAAAICLSLMFGYYNSASAQSDPATNVQTFVPVSTFVPNELPLAIENSSLFRTIDGETVLKFSVTNTTTENLRNLQFLILIVDPKGNIKSGQGWRSENRSGALSTSANEIGLKHPVANGDRVVLVSYEAISELKTYSVAPTRVLNELADNGTIKVSKKFVKTVGTKLTQSNPCAAAQNAAAQACTCGIKSFSCNPQTGAYSFTCFSQQENPSACPEGPPES